MPREPSSFWTGLSAETLPVGSVYSFLQDGRAGGVCVFVGTSRRWTGSVETEALTYEAYPPMAEAELDRLARASADRWDAFRVVVLHRTGRVAPPDASVVVGVSCAHRAEAFEACRWLIDTLKHEVPIWKTEHAPHLPIPKPSA